MTAQGAYVFSLEKPTFTQTTDAARQAAMTPVPPQAA
jgi:hypothetical protein